MTERNILKIIYEVMIYEKRNNKKIIFDNSGCDNDGNAAGLQLKRRRTDYRHLFRP